MNAGRIGIVGDVRRDGGRVPLEGAQSKADRSIPGTRGPDADIASHIRNCGPMEIAPFHGGGTIQAPG